MGNHGHSQIVRDYSKSVRTANLSSVSFEGGLASSSNRKPRRAAAVSLWKHKRLFGARPSGRPKTRKVLLDRTGGGVVRSTDSLAPGGKLTSSSLPSSPLPRKVGIKKALCKYTLTHGDGEGDGLLTCKSGRVENECGINVNGCLIWEIKVKSRLLMNKT